MATPLPTPIGTLEHDWANTEQTIPKQQQSLVGCAARLLRRSPVQTPRPFFMLSSERVASRQEGYHQALDEETKIVQAAHASVHRLEFLADDESQLQLDRFCKAETAELQAAGGYFGPRGKPTGARAARPAALTVLVEAANQCGLDGDALLAASREDRAREGFDANTEEASKRQVFGAPTYIYKDEVFWGQDRLDFLERALAD